ncbi:hypothetical protein BCL52_1926 [Salisediminibacterium halotolerans]|nr:hypothetical protein BCL39_1929 [Actinophytocola xinjiangensis]RPE86602.1 hypothetical protein EDD67_2052 [Salisediminibacterium halotolerans]TWG33977.1 hypothetical protein BCL52_1926 [Salisediminibacterium halotolerans]
MLTEKFQEVTLIFFAFVHLFALRSVLAAALGPSQCSAAPRSACHANDGERAAAKYLRREAARSHSK